MGKKTIPAYKPRIIYAYSTKHLAVKDKVRFYYGLKGREGDTGIVKDCRIKQLGKTVLLVHIKFSKEVEEFLSYWKCKYNKYEVMIR